MIQVVGKDEEVYKQVTCKNCASVLRYLPVDVKSSKYTDISGCTENWFSINCPTCSNIVEVERPYR